jgi:hypothetical protein
LLDAASFYWGGFFLLKTTTKGAGTFVVVGTSSMLL